MEIREQLNRQRIKHIISSYQLDSNETEAFNDDLERLLNDYSSPLIELAIVETLVDGWLQVPMVRGCAFLTNVSEQLRRWEEQVTLQNGSSQSQVFSTISPAQFQQITGLDPSPIFGISSTSTAPSPIHPLG